MRFRKSSSAWLPSAAIIPRKMRKRLVFPTSPPVIRSVDMLLKSWGLRGVHGRTYGHAPYPQSDHDDAYDAFYLALFGENPIGHEANETRHEEPNHNTNGQVYVLDEKILVQSMPLGTTQGSRRTARDGDGDVATNIKS